MARTSSRLYVPLDVAFFDDDKTVDAGEAASWLYLNMLAKAKMMDSDGVLTRQQISRLSVANWQKRLSRLVAVGLVTNENSDSYAISAWLNWNESRADREERLAEDRRRKAERSDKSTKNGGK